MSQTLSVGAILRDRYRIIELVGQGGMGAVYKAEDLRLSGRVCAVKEILPELISSPGMEEQAHTQFYREASILARLDHPNLPKVSDFFSIEDNDFLVMDYVPGDDLRATIAKADSNGRFLPEEDVLNWAVQIGDALSYMHNQTPSILHRDIKPSNLKVTPNGVIKLVDFGLVKLLAPGEVTITIMQGQGTAIYTPLEQYGGDTSHTDARSDVYAFGCTIYHLLTNKAPVNVRDRFLSPESLTPPRVINPAITPRVEEAILWAMELHPDDRPKNVTTFIKALTGESTGNLRRFGNSYNRSVFPKQLGKTEERLSFIAGGLVFITLLLTLLHNL